MLLHCAVDTVRRIPLEALPVYRVGKCNLYLRAEVVRYLRTRRLQRPAVDQLLDEVPLSNEIKDFDVTERSTPDDVLIGLERKIPRVIGSKPVDVRGRSSRRTL